MITTTAPGLLTDEMLARFDERAPATTGRTASSTRTSRSCAGPATCRARCPPSSAAPGLGLDEVRRARAAARLRRPGHGPGRRTCTSTGPAWPPTCCATGDESCRFDPRAGGRGRDLRRAPRRGRQRHAPAAVDRGRRAGRRRVESSAGTRSSAASHRCGPTAGSTPWTPPIPTTPTIVHGFLPRDAPGLQIVDTWDTLGMRATQSQDTVLDDAFVPDELVPARVPGRLRRRRPVPGGDLRLGADGLRRRLPRRRPAGLRHHRRDACRTRTSIALTRSMAHHPEVQHDVAEMRIALRRGRGAARAHLRRLGRTASSTSDWPVRLVGTRIVRDQPGLRHRRPGPRPLRRRRRLQAQPPRAALPRRPHGSLPPRATRCWPTS